MIGLPIAPAITVIKNKKAARSRIALKRAKGRYQCDCVAVPVVDALCQTVRVTVMSARTNVEKPSNLWAPLLTFISTPNRDLP